MGSVQRIPGLSVRGGGSEEGAVATGVLPLFLHLSDTGNIPYRIPLYSSSLLQLNPLSDNLC